MLGDSGGAVKHDGHENPAWRAFRMGEPQTVREGR
jgi:hypothetical protein